MNLTKLAQGARSFLGGAHKAVTAIQGGALKTVTAVDLASTTVEKATKLVQDVTDIQAKGGQLVAQIQDSTSRAVATSQITKATRFNFTGNVMFQKEQMLREKIDPLFTEVLGDADLRRVGFSFLPQKMPSGTTVPMGKPQINEILFNQAKKKSTFIEIPTKDGIFRYRVEGKPFERSHELVFLASLERQTDAGDVEKITTHFYPQSSDLYKVSVPFDGAKSVMHLQGGAEGGKVISTRQAQLSSAQQPKLEEAKILPNQTPLGEGIQAS